MTGLAGAVIIVGIGGALFALSLTQTTTLPSTSSFNSPCSVSRTFTPINVKVQFQDFAVDALTSRLFGLGYNGTQNVYEFNPTTNSVISVFSLSSASSAIAYDNLTNSLYIASYGLSSSVLVVNASNFSMIKNISLSTSPDNLVFDPDNGEIYVASYRSDLVSVINGSTNNVVSEIKTSLSPSEFAYVSQNKEMYVTTVSVNTSRSEVNVINTLTNSIIAQIPVSANLSLPITYDQANGEIYLGSLMSNNVTIISTSTNQIIGTVLMPYEADAISYNPTDLDIYVPSNATGGAISTIDSGTSLVQTPVSGLGFGPSVVFAFAYDPDNGVLFVASGESGTMLAISANHRPLSCLSTSKPVYSVSISNPYLISSPNNHTFTFSYGLIPSQNASVFYNGTLSYLMRYSGNPEWQKLTNGSWIPTNSSAVSGSIKTPLWKLTQNELSVTMQSLPVPANETGEFVFNLNVGSALPVGYYGLVLNVYVGFSQSYAIVYTGLIPLQVI